MSTVDTKAGEQILRLQDFDTGLIEYEYLPALKDLTGETLRGGDKVAWGTSYRGGGGAVIGIIDSIDWVPTKYAAYAVDEAGNYVTEPYVWKDWRGGEHQSNRPITVAREFWRPRIVVSSLMAGRKGRIESSSDFFVKIANQQFGDL